MLATPSVVVVVVVLEVVAVVVVAVVVVVVNKISYFITQTGQKKLETKT
jgi:hypothetical protein